MAAVLTLDTIEGAELLVDQTGSRRVRTGTITGLDVDSSADPRVLEKALEVIGLPGIATTYPGDASVLLARVYVTGLSNDSVRVRLEYEPINYGGQPTAYYISDGTSLVTESINIHPGLGSRIEVGADFTVDGQAYSVPKQTITMEVPRPLRQIQVNAIKLGVPNHSLNYVGYVNETSWPSEAPLPKGYWLMDRYETRFSKFQGYYELTASASSRVVKDWMMQGIVVDPSTGQYVPVPASEITSLLNTGYVYGQNVGNGVISVGWFPTVSFAGVFGF